MSSVEEPGGVEPARGTGDGEGQAAEAALASPAPAAAEGPVIPDQAAPGAAAAPAEAAPQPASALEEPPMPPTPPPELPRGASGAELDSLRVALKKAPRSLPPGVAPTRLPSARAPSLPPPAALLHKPELDRLIDEGRGLLESDVRAAHAIFERAWLRNLNDARVLSHYGLTLVLVEGDRQRGIRFCEEAVRRGPPTSEFLINLARALVQTRNKEQAVRALKKAGELAPDDPRVRAEFEALGLRRRPPLAFLPRNFFLNRWLGRLTWRLRRSWLP